MIGSLIERQPILIVAGAISLILAIVTVVLSLADDGQVLGISRWIKPTKFFVSITIFVWTMAALFDLMPQRANLFGLLSWIIIAIFVVEMVIITGQAARGVTSHFNAATRFDSWLFATMGIAIALLTLSMFYVTYLFFSNELDVPSAITWGIRLGLVMFLLGSIQGAYMSSHMSHAVGVPDGGPGLPFVNWSTNGGDLRVSHFLGMHGLQAIPLFALIVERLQFRNSVALTVGFAASYAAAFVFTFGRAVVSRPLISF